MSLKYRKEENLPVPFEINSSKDFDIFINNCKENYVIVKQNYPNFHNEEFLRLKKYDFKDKKIIYANSEKSNNVVGSNESLEKICAKSKEWIDNKVGEYLNFFYKKNNLKIVKEEYEGAVNTWKN